MTPTCASCGNAGEEGQRFCEECGGEMVLPAPEPPPGEMCANCGTPLRSGARFCAACGTAAGPARCHACRAELRPNARFCGSCGATTSPAPSPVPAGAPAQPATPAPTPVQAPAPGPRSSPFGRPAARTAPPRVPQRPRAPRTPGAAPALAWGTLTAAAGFALAILGTFTDWISARGQGFGAFEEDAAYRIGDWLDYNDLPVDGLLVLAAAAAGLAVAVAAMAGKMAAGPARTVITILGPALTTLGILQMQFISSEFDGTGIDVDWGMGLWLIMIGGIAASVSGFIPQQRRP